MPISALGSMKDVTSEYITKEQLQSAAKMNLEPKGTLIASIVFDTKTNEIMEYSSHEKFINQIEIADAPSWLSKMQNIYVREDTRQKIVKLYNSWNIKRNFEKGETISYVDGLINVGEKREIWTRAYVRSYFDAHTGNIVAVGHLYDVDLEKSRETMLKALVDDMYEYILLIDVETGVVDNIFNSKNYKSPLLKGQNIKEESLDTIYSYFYPQERDSAIKKLSHENVAKQMRGNDVYSVDFYVLDAVYNGVRRKVWNYIWLNSDKKKIICARTDITDAFKREREQRETIEASLKMAENANLAKTDFLSAMSHDIRTPMNAIVGMTDMALEEMDDKISVENCLRIIRNSSRHLVEIVNDILDLNRIESGLIVEEDSEFDVTQEVDLLIERFNHMMDEKNLKFTLDIDIEHKTVIGDSLRIQRVMDNLLSNAIKFTPNDGTIGLKIEEIEQKNNKLAIYSIIVSDSGCGMDEDEKDKIFEPFFRSKRVQDAQIEGTGLGLPLVKNIVEFMGGNIQVESKSENGTTIEITLPLQLVECETRFVIHNDREKNEIDFSDLKVLLVEDNVINQMVAQKMLSHVKATVDTVNNGQEAYDKFIMSEQGEYDVILTDIRMPVMNGYESAEKIRASAHPDAKSVVIIAMTANAFVEDVKKSLQSGMNEHITKPIDIKELYRKIQKLTEKSRGKNDENK
ncbi:MAG: ATP-binding protein [Synergistaceae bacterium]